MSSEKSNMSRSSDGSTPNIGVLPQEGDIRPVEITALASGGRGVARHEGIQVLLDWVEELPEDDRQLFMHCGLEGLSYTEVGERMGLGKDTVAKRWQKLRGRIEQFAIPVGVDPVTGRDARGSGGWHVALAP